MIYIHTGVPTTTACDSVTLANSVANRLSTSGQHNVLLSVAEVLTDVFIIFNFISVQGWVTVVSSKFREGSVFSSLRYLPPLVKPQTYKS